MVEEGSGAVAEDSTPVPTSLGLVDGSVITIYFVALAAVVGG